MDLAILAESSGNPSPRCCSAALRFDQIGASAPATWVAYSVSASDQQTPWGTAAFRVGWKPISFMGGCCRLAVDGVETGIVLALGRWRRTLADFVLLACRDARAYGTFAFLVRTTRLPHAPR